MLSISILPLQPLFWPVTQDSPFNFGDANLAKPLQIIGIVIEILCFIFIVYKIRSGSKIQEEEPS